MITPELLAKWIIDNCEIQNEDPLSKYIYSKKGNVTIYHIPNSVFMNFDIPQIKKHYSHFSWQTDSRWNYYEVCTELRDLKQLKNG
jgi:hypothetical protein